ncbi:hypothetical protein HDU96_009529, partial [Phlyctochytrium bullatum]
SDNNTNGSSSGLPSFAIPVIAASAAFLLLLILALILFRVLRARRGRPRAPSFPAPTDRTVVGKLSLQQSAAPPQPLLRAGSSVGAPASEASGPDNGWGSQRDNGWGSQRDNGWGTKRSRDGFTTPPRPSPGPNNAWQPTPYDSPYTQQQQPYLQQAYPPQPISPQQPYPRSPSRSPSAPSLPRAAPAPLQGFPPGTADFYPYVPPTPAVAPPPVPPLPLPPSKPMQRVTPAKRRSQSVGAETRGVRNPYEGEEAYRFDAPEVGRRSAEEARAWENGWRGREEWGAGAAGRSD